MQADDAPFLVDDRQLVNLVEAHQLKHRVPSQLRRHNQGVTVGDGFDSAAQVQPAQQAPPYVPVGESAEESAVGRDHQDYLQAGLVEISARLLQSRVWRQLGPVPQLPGCWLISFQQ